MDLRPCLRSDTSDEKRAFFAKSPRLSETPNRAQISRKFLRNPRVPKSRKEFRETLVMGNIPPARNGRSARCREQLAVGQDEGSRPGCTQCTNGHCSVTLLVCTAVPSASLQTGTGHPVPSQCQPSAAHCSAQCCPVSYRSGNRRT